MLAFPSGLYYITTQMRTAKDQLKRLVAKEIERQTETDVIVPVDDVRIQNQQTKSTPAKTTKPTKKKKAAPKPKKKALAA